MNPEISICLPTVNGQYLDTVLEAIFNNKFQNFEVIVNDSSNSVLVKEILEKYDIKVIRKLTKSLESRFLTSMVATGYNVFLLDDTRVISDSLMEKIQLMKNDMIIIGERDIGGGILNFVSNLDKTIIPTAFESLNPRKNKSIIPRVYKREILNESFKRISDKLPRDVHSEVVGLDLELIYLESYEQTSNIGIISSPEISHFGDTNLTALFRKYYRYGRSQKMLRNTSYSEFAGLGGRNRTTLPVADRLRSFPIQFIRGVPFVMGYLVG